MTWGAPTAPDSTSSRILRKLWSNRRLKPTWSFTPALATASSAARTLATVRSTGFSQKTCLPAAAALATKSACVSVEEQMRTASRSRWARRAEGSLRILGMPREAAQASISGVSLRSAIAATRAWGMK